MPAKRMIYSSEENVFIWFDLTYNLKRGINVIVPDKLWIHINPIQWDPVIYASDLVVMCAIAWRKISSSDILFFNSQKKTTITKAAYWLLAKFCLIKIYWIMSMDLESWNSWLWLNCNLRFPLFPFKTSGTYWLLRQRTEIISRSSLLFWWKWGCIKEEIKTLYGSKQTTVIWISLSTIFSMHLAWKQMLGNKRFPTNPTHLPADTLVCFVSLPYIYLWLGCFIRL